MSSLDMQAMLDRLVEAWGANSPEQVAQCFHPDGIYHASVGDGPGEEARGHLAIKALVARMMDADANSTAQIDNIVVTDELAVSSWVYIFPDGSREYGCDIIKTRGGKIILKDAYRKVRAIPNFRKPSQRQNGEST